MITYQYKAVSVDGAKVRGVIQATDEYTAVEKIKSTCPIVIKVTPVKEKTGFLTKEIGNPKIDTKALSVMCSQFAIILKSGVSIATCMEMIADQTEDKKLKKMLIGSAEDVSQGNSVASSFEKNCKGLPITFVETVRAGEQSGTLENSFNTLEKYYEKSYKTSQKVRRALSYPIFVISVAIVVMIIVMVKVIPTVSSIFDDLGGDMPMITKMLIGMSVFFQENILLIIGVILVVIIGLKLYCNTEKGRILWNTFKLNIPILGKIALLNGASQYANTMAALLTAGLSVHKSLEITAKIMDNYVLSLETSRMTGSIEEGKKLGECMRKCKHFPKTLTEMCAIGEETGELEETLGTIGSYFDNEADHATAQAIAKLEPTIMVLMALFAGFIVIAVYLPMFKIYDMI
ncbi:MAG: type II secretion system F family protein [Anaerovoracaceae bacterium]